MQAKLLEPGYEFTGEQAFPHSKWYGHQKAHLDHCCFVIKGLEFAPQQIPQNHSWVKWLWLVADGKLITIIKAQDTKELIYFIILCHKSQIP